jgi:glycosyltransferase involved in cell wall biosynthesis
VDDGSVDGTGEVARAYGDRVRVLESGGRGPSAARNRGIEAASGHWIAFLDSDDVWTPRRLAAQMEAVAADPAVGLVCGRMEVFDDEGSLDPVDVEHPPDGIAGFYLERLLRRNFIHTQSVLVRRAVLEKVGLFDEELRHSEDLELWSRVLARYPAMFVDEVLSRQRRRPGSLSSDFEAMYAAQEAIVDRRLNEEHFPSERRVRIRAALRSWMRLDRAELRMGAGDAGRARRDLNRHLRLRPWSPKGWWLFLLLHLPPGWRDGLRGGLRRLRASWSRAS